jgi:hypothetical protein
MRTIAASVLFATLAILPPAAGAVPDSVQFQAYVTDAEGDPFEGVVDVRLSIHRTLEGGGAEFLELHSDVEIVAGVLAVPLGAGLRLFGFMPLILDGDYWLQMEIDGEVLLPRQRLRSVAAAQAAGYAEEAERAFDSDRLAGLGPEEFQRSLGNSCAEGFFLRRINPDGTIECGADDTGPGDITDVNAGTGLFGGSSGGPVTLSVDFDTVQRRVSGSCGDGEYVRAIGSTGSVTCGEDANAGGDITSVVVGNGMIGGGDSGIVVVAVDQGGIDTPLLADDAVTTAKLAPQSVGTAQIAPFSVGEGQIAGGAIDSAHIEPASLFEPVLANSAVSNRVLGNGAVTAEKLAGGAVNSGHLSDAAVFPAHLHATVYNRVPRFGYTQNLDDQIVQNDPVLLGSVSVETPASGVVHYQADAQAFINVEFGEDDVVLACWLGTGPSQLELVAGWTTTRQPGEPASGYPRISTVVPASGSGSGLGFFCRTSGQRNTFVDEVVLTATFYPELP